MQIHPDLLGICRAGTDRVGLYRGDGLDGVAHTEVQSLLKGRARSGAVAPQK